MPPLVSAPSSSSQFHRKLKCNYLQVVTNFQIIESIDKYEELVNDIETLGAPKFKHGMAQIFRDRNEGIVGIYEMVFPRLSFLDLEGTLIQTHLDIFR